MREATLHTLNGPGFSLVLEETAEGALVWRHWGAEVNPLGVAPLAATQAGATFSLDSEVPLSLVPTSGLGWFGEPGLRCRRGEPIIVRLVLGHVDRATDLMRFVLQDQIAGIEVTVAFAALGGCVCITTAVRNLANEPLSVERLASAVLPITTSARQIVSFTGRHNAELHEHIEYMPAQGWLRETRQGLTGHAGPAGLFVLGEAAGWHAGEVWALQLATGADHRLVLEPEPSGGWVLVAEAGCEGSQLCVLGPGERYEVPDVLACFSSSGRNGAIAGFHAAIRARLNWPGTVMRPRPVHFNTWESVYFAHDEARILELVECAAELGVERFVLDDGWFKGRAGDCAGLGDWTPDPVRYPSGLLPIARRCVALGMEFGLWVEPEMVNLDSDLYRAHPDWVLGSGRVGRIPTARHQLVLDMARAEVRDHLYQQLSFLLEALPIGYLKWDHNRAPAPGRRDLGSHAESQIRGTWDLWDRLRERFPSIEIEACAAGGGRIDAGFATRAHRFWPSDNIDALSRVAIQRGFLQFMPPELMGAHVGSSPAHATGRMQSLDFRAMVALPGHFGVELDPGNLDADDRARLVYWLGRYMSLRDRFHAGPCALGEGADGLLWQAYGRSPAMLLLVIRKEAPVARREAPLRLPMLANTARLRVKLIDHCGIPESRQPRVLDDLLNDGLLFTGSWLASHGLPLPNTFSEAALLFEIEAA